MGYMAERNVAGIFGRRSKSASIFSENEFLTLKRTKAKEPMEKMMTKTVVKKSHMTPPSTASEQRAIVMMQTSTYYQNVTTRPCQLIS
jgi:hypothetical protein